MPTPIDASSAQQALKALADALSISCPDLRQEARLLSQQILDKHGIGHLDPDNVWFHRWHSSVSSPRTFTGWEHVGTPYQSLTFPQLVMHRFYASDQDNADNLQQMDGFYTAGPHAGSYNERNEVRLIPADVLQDFWQFDFSSFYKNKLYDFWADHGDDYRTLAKANYLSKALQALDAKHLSYEEFQVVVYAVAGEIQWPVDLHALTRDISIANPHGLKVCAFDIGGHVASDILRIVDADGYQYLYVPGDGVAFHVFETWKDLYWWVMNQTNEAENRARFLSHFPRELQDEEKDGHSGLNHMLDLLFYGWGNHAKPVNQKDIALTQDPFTFLTQSMKARMEADAEFCLRSNAQIRKQMWIGYLDAFSKTFGAMAAVDWPVALAVVGAGLADMGLNIDQAINGHTTAERRAGVLGAIGSAIDALFNSLFLLEAGGAAASELKPLEAAVSAADMEALLPEPLKPVKADQLLAPFETNEILEGNANLAVEGNMRGIQFNDQGETFVDIDGLAYQVRFVKEMQSWVVVDPANPYSFYKHVPVRLTAEGQWQALSPGKLKGGGKFFGSRPWGSSTSSTAPRALTPTYRYDIPVEVRAKVEYIADGNGDKALQGYARSHEDALLSQQVIDVRETLKTDAEAFFKDLDLPPRPDLPALDPAANEQQIITQLLEKYPGIVVGESHSSIASKKFLIDNMKYLARQKVRTLYMEHLLTDFQQVDLDEFARSGKMSEKLEKYLKAQDRGHGTDASGRYTFQEVVRRAGKYHIRVQAIDCLASYRTAGLSDPTYNVRQRLMNFFAHHVIRADQAIHGADKWIALVGNTHANTFEGVPGVADIEGAIGLRIEDVPAGTSRGLHPDNGIHTPRDPMDKTEVFVKNDLVYQIETLSENATAKAMEQRLIQPGMFGINAEKGMVVHRSGDNSLVYTPIQQERGNVFIHRPRWAYVSDRRFESINELAKALQAIGMKWVA